MWVSVEPEANGGLTIEIDSVQIWVPAHKAVELAVGLVSALAADIVDEDDARALSAALSAPLEKAG